MMGFDPLIPTNWYQQPKDRIKKIQGIDGVGGDRMIEGVEGEDRRRS